MTPTTPLVAIRCITYNQAAYIRQCLDGFVMQRTDFAFVAIVHDDCSTDGTDDIVREYAQRYPHIIKPIFETENQYSKGDGSLSRIMTQACNNTGAKYIAMCEGDDYWTDPLKLQKAAFLSMNTIRVILYSKGKKERIVFQDISDILASEIEQTYCRNCDVEQLLLGGARILVNECTRQALLT